ncbi:transporter substrate-binding domain-containing protein [Ruminococcaceae bacterium OttesenSCG-928-I18]|nr:transporter substrate-binding domain-containing protein [Ruminococcaceae bacterium OttesenSCG-928-I18]
MKIKLTADPFAPYQYYDDSGNITGLDYELVRRAFEVTGHETSVSIMDWPLAEQAVLSGQAHGAFQVQPTAERMGLYHFSRLLRDAVTEIVSTRSDLTLNAYQDLPGQCGTLGVIKDYCYGQFIDELDEIQKVPYENHEELLRAVYENQVDSAVIDRGVRIFTAAKLGIDNLSSYPALDFIRPLHVIFNLENKPLCSDFDKGLEKIRQNGDYDQIISKYS